MEASSVALRFTPPESFFTMAYREEMKPMKGRNIRNTSPSEWARSRSSAGKGSFMYFAVTSPGSRPPSGGDHLDAPAAGDSSSSRCSTFMPPVYLAMTASSSCS